MKFLIESPYLILLYSIFYCGLLYYYQQPIGEVLNAALPKIIRQGNKIKPVKNTVYKVTDVTENKKTFYRAPKQRLLYELIKSHSEGIDEQSIKDEIKNWRPITKSLIEKKLISKTQLDKIDKNIINTKIFERN